MANLKVERIITTNATLFPTDRKAQSFGAYVDAQIAGALDAGERLQSVEIFFEASDWLALETKRFPQAAAD